MTLILFLLAVAGYFIIQNMPKVAADTISWSGPLSSRNRDDLPSNGIPAKRCIQQDIYVGNSTTPDSACVYYAKSFRFASLSKLVWTSPWSNYMDNYFVVGIGNDTRMYRTEGNGIGNIPLFSADSDNLLYVSGGTAYEIKDFPSKLIRTVRNDLSTGYNLMGDAMHAYHFDENGNYLPVGNSGSGMSSNGKWAAIQIKYMGLLRINLDDFSVKLFARGNAYNYGQGQDPGYGFAVSNDGRYVLADGGNVPSQIFDLDGSCGDTASGVQGSWKNGTISNPCPVAVDFHVMLPGIMGVSDYIRSTDNAQFSDDGGQLDLYVTMYNTPSRWITVNASGYTMPPQLDYLALGDSFSSGEGDLQKTSTGRSHYLPGTDVLATVTQPTENCHVSDRSYPFLLAKSIGLTSSNWKSVACSGATTIDINGKNDGYNGQPVGSNQMPRLQGLSNVSLFKTNALQNFTPGRNTQIEFVKKYQPKVITLTAGGNDVGFASIIRACIDPNVNLSSICAYAADDSAKAGLGQSIRNMYPKLVKLYTDLYQASSGQSKIYVLGYPQFVDDQPSNSTCGLNVRLNNSERTMIREGVSYLNSVIKSAAERAGVKYIDIEDSLNGHQLCDNNPAVNGIASFTDENAQQGSFHPNAYGQSLINQAINSTNNLNGQNPLLYNVCSGDNNNCPDASITEPAMPAYFANPVSATGVQNSIYQVVTNTAVAYGIVFPPSLLITLPTLILNPNNPANILIYSDPENLGSFTPNTDGSLSANITLPDDLPLGYHTIVISGQTPSGENIRYWQLIKLNSTNSTDLDGNGIADTQQSCMGIEQAGIDADKDGVDDACDPDISSTPQLYRLRQGDAARIYNGSAENFHYLYIERNTRASSITGITGDYDPDNDGWAIVGVSQGKPYTTTSVPDTGPAANFVVTGSGGNSKPYVYIRAGGYGCAEYTPTSLSKVLSGQSRTIKLTAENTNKCRQEAVSDDVDGNGQPDNTQPLYMARQGDSTIQHTKPDNTTFYEDPTRIYLFRNYYASETQLGISDYSPTGTAAGRPSEPIQQLNLLATSLDSYTPAYNKLVMLTDSNNKPLPTILTKKQNGQCIAYQPESTDIIKMTTQYTRGFNKLTTLPQGVNCD